MNNAKVRIYELSKELNLENKDILEICEQLNIAVKSHSSTITESQAERIKASAEQYASHTTGKPPHKRASQTAESGKGERKQQILAIHHKQGRSAPSGEAASASKSAVLATPPKPPVAQSSSSTTLSSPNPLEMTTDRAKPEANLSAPYSPTPPTQKQAQGEREVEKAAIPPKLEVPQLRRPPSRSSDTNVEPTSSQGSSSQPIITKSPSSASSPSEEKVKSEVVALKQSTKVKPQKELTRPQPPKASREEVLEPEVLVVRQAERSDEEPLDDEENLLLPRPQKPKLNQRPSPPRQGKTPVWEDEEEDDKTGAGKAGKGAAKGKRRSQLIVDDEDEDFDSELGVKVLPTSVSISIARPPKPKEATQAPKAPSSASKPKKNPVKAEGDSVKSKSEKRDRREVEQRPESIILSGSLTVRDLADLLRVPETDIIKNLFFKGIAVNITQTLELETARLVAEEFGVQVEAGEQKATAAKTTEMLDEGDLENLQRRPPVVTIMGHVDHGKTTLLDSIRQTKVAQGEAGGITQHIGAYHVDLEHDGKPEQIVFLDTPGHEAFTAMRARGARVTDIAILVVAADDGVQPQTREAISHAKAAKVPIVVAINKVDKLEANPDRIKQELSEQGLVPEEWGGDTIMVPVSALKGENLDSLLEMILLVSELEELSANPERLAKGTVIEANLDRTRGPVATLLVQNGTLRVGDVIVAGSVFGKIRAMIDDRGDKVEAATPSFAVEVLGINDVPAAGDEFEVLPSEKEARLLAEKGFEEQRQSRLQQAMSSRRVTLSSLSAQAQEGELKDLNLILKADVQGSVEAILGALQQLPQNEVQIRVLLAAPGEVTETDVDLAAASGAVVVGFNTTLASGSRAAADREGVDIREYNIIYKLLDDIQGAMEGLLEPEEVESHLGQAQVRAVFPVGRGAVAGCYVQSGKLVRNRYIRVRRGGEVVYQGVLDSLKRVKDDVKEVNAGYECGIGIDKFNDWQEGDIIEAYEMVMKRRTLSAN